MFGTSIFKNTFIIRLQAASCNLNRSEAELGGANCEALAMP